MGTTEHTADQRAGRGAETTPPSAAFPPLAAAGLDDLLRELLQRVDEVVADQRRLRLLLDAVVLIAADLSFDSVLERIVQVASELVGARYAALGVLGSGTEPLRAFINTGISVEQRELIGDLPRGHGLLGLIIDQPEPLRLHDIAAHPASYGFPDHHPEMHSFLGVPIRIGDRVFGNLYLTEKEGNGDFSEEDEAVVVALAAAAGVVIENARLYEEASRREHWLAATAEITGLLSAGVGRSDALQTVADRAREVASADVATVVMRTDGDELDLVVVSGLSVLPQGNHARPTIRGSLAGAVIESGETMVVEDARRDPRVAHAVMPKDWPALGPLLLVPLRTLDGVEGVLTLGWATDHLTTFRTVDVPMAERFAAQAALALQIARAREDREKLAVFEDRDRIGRDLHDLVIQRLFAIGLGLENTARMAQQHRRAHPDHGGRRRHRRHDQGHPPLHLRAERGRGLDGPAGHGHRAGRPGDQGPRLPAQPAVRGPGGQRRHRGRGDPRHGRAGRGADQRRPARRGVARLGRAVRGGPGGADRGRRRARHRPARHPQRAAQHAGAGREPRRRLRRRGPGRGRHRRHLVGARASGTTRTCRAGPGIRDQSPGRRGPKGLAPGASRGYRVDVSHNRHQRHH